MRCYLRQFPRRSVAHSLNNTSLTSFYSCICPLRSNFYTSAKVLSLWCSDCAAIIGQPICSFSLLSVGRFINRHTPVNANFLQHIHRLGLLMKNFWSFSDCCSFFLRIPFAILSYDDWRMHCSFFRSPELFTETLSHFTESYRRTSCT